ncbi:MAG: ATP-binding protein [Myxococcota bacterium]
MTEDFYKKKYEQAQARVAILEQMIEDRARELYLVHEKSRTMALFADLNPAPVLRVDVQSTVLCSNPAAVAVLGDGAETGANLAEVLPGLNQVDLKHCIEQSRVAYFETQLDRRHFHFVVRGVASDQFANIYGSDTTDIKQLEIELRHAQKLESVGQLAAGIAHEINTPMQFIGDNVHFLKSAFQDVLDVVHAYASHRAEFDAIRVSSSALSEIDEALESADIDYLRERAPKAFDRTLGGVSRVSEIVAAMKSFSHPQREQAPVDLNEAVRVTLTVAKNEYKYIADVETDFGALPSILCHGGDINQVLLNLIVNAAHAIEDVSSGHGGRGLIRVRTYVDGDRAVVSVSDSGSGIPVSIRNRIFDPFFTTKEVGRGTGQGLALVHAIVVDRHGGSIDFETESGVGTTFFVRLPLQGKGEPADGVRR